MVPNNPSSHPPDWFPDYIQPARKMRRKLPAHTPIKSRLSGLQKYPTKNVGVRTLDVPDKSVDPMTMLPRSAGRLATRYLQGYSGHRCRRNTPT